MGLDMYLYSQKYVSGYDHRDEEERKQYETIVKVAGLEDVVDPQTPGLIVEATVAYWRKANSIHRWFVDNVQGGEDDCRDYPVSREQLAELRALCKRVLDSLELTEGEVMVAQVHNPATGEWEARTESGQVASKTALAEELLPSQSGFFFGSTEYDQWYADDLKQTIEQLDRVLASDEYDFVYRSSW